MLKKCKNVKNERIKRKPLYILSSPLLGRENRWLKVDTLDDADYP